MKTTVRYLSLNAQASWHEQVEKQLEHLHGLMAITGAEVVLEHLHDASPAFRVEVRLEVPGPAIHTNATRKMREAALLVHGPALRAEARDNTIEAALLKVTHEIEHQVDARQLRLLERGKSRLQMSGVSSRWTQARTNRNPSPSP